ncbi:acetyl-CoA acetyltransferase [Jezberella montanilacus]|jgi:acetyl-CoA acetyltransferase|uniref:Acetyl-CoA acetyltransferase n=1 Tax=Jezberella montanilacus TaxID=323426 RepID=A0A2T0XHP7_9BURK|nr:thiolase family protein [Jezberella montanilacus]PRY98474.1 acetyl-CoA acetyltransferase [Jezberella montanilacus]
MSHAYIAGVGNTPFGRLEGFSSIDLMARAASAALTAAQLSRQEIDGVLCGYATTLPHLMLSTLFCEKFSLRPNYCHGMQVGGATGAAMLMLARELVVSGRCRHVLVVAGENRLTGQTRDSSIQTLAQVGDADFEVPNGASVPAYYGLMASRYLHETGVTSEDLAEFAVLMRGNAARHPDAHLRDPITVADVLASKTIAAPLRLMDCCPISDGAMALVVSAEPRSGVPVRIAGAGQGHFHQHLTAMVDVLNTGAAHAAKQAFEQANLSAADMDYLGIYDSFTITLVMLLEEIGFAPRAGAVKRLRAGDFSQHGNQPLNTHGGLLSFGHCGVAGGLAHTAEAWRQFNGLAGTRQVKSPKHAFIHADGGVMSSHVSLILAREG